MIFPWKKSPTSQAPTTNSVGIQVFPSIWWGEFRSVADWKRIEPVLAERQRVTDAMEDDAISSRHRFSRLAWCACCQRVTEMSFGWWYCNVSEGGSVNPAWSETFNCKVCGLNSRMRAVFAFLRQSGINRTADIYTTEAITDGYKALKKEFPQTVGSEYLAHDLASGARRDFGGVKGVLHQDLHRLSFETNTFDVVVTQEVFEHVPDYVRAFGECHRVLRPGGSLIFTIPFFHHTHKTVRRARLSGTKGDQVEHILPAVYHGNPVDDAGSLVFQDFGWDVLEELRSAGFVSASAHAYWGPWQGHFGSHFFVFRAQKASEKG